MEILLTGASGQLGHELHPLLSQHGHVTGVDRQPGPGVDLAADLAELSRLEALLDRLKPGLVVNAAAYTQVDQSEADTALAFRLNAELPACLAAWCRRNEAKLVHYSTDYVFDGRADSPYPETATPRPINSYGMSKLSGEWAIQASGCRHVILRTSWVYSTHGNNFVLTMLRLARQRSELGVVADQTGCPTWARNLALASDQVIRQFEFGGAVGQDAVFNYCDATVTTWHDFARMIFEQGVALGLLKSMPKLNPIRSADFPQKARRPNYSVLDTQRIRQRFGIEPADLQPSLAACLSEYSK